MQSYMRSIVRNVRKQNAQQYSNAMKDLVGYNCLLNYKVLRIILNRKMLSLLIRILGLFYPKFLQFGDFELLLRFTFLDVERLMFITKTYMISFNFMTNCIRFTTYGYLPNIIKHIQKRRINPQELQVYKTANIKFRKRMCIEMFLHSFF